ncbi:MAG: ABC transporter permease [Spirochaetales bacterium]|nr:ABC transporter permease [Spirochaetales bacterium]
MKFLLSLAWKNLFRYGRRTFITAAALAVGIAAYIWMDGWLLGAERESERNIVWYESGSAKIMDADYARELKTMPLEHTIEDPGAVEAALRDVGVEHTGRVRFAGELFFGEGSLMVQAIAVDPETDERVFRLSETVAEGTYLGRGGAGSDAGGGPGGEAQALIGRWLAEDLGAGVGDLLEIRTRTRHGAFQTIELLVAGILDSPNPMVNQGTVFLPLSLADETLQMEGSVTEIALYFPEWQEPEEKMNRIGAALAGFPELALVGWRELARDYLMIAQAKTGASSVILLLVFIIAAVGISNTMLMAVYERIREIGMMRAMGMQDGAIRLTFLLEAGGIGLLGSAAGLALGAGINFYMVRWGVDLGALMGRMEIGYRVHSVFRAAWNPQALVGGLVFGVLASMVVSFIPSSRALKMGITDCLRHT